MPLSRSRQFLTYEEQISRLKGKHLIIIDEEGAKKALSEIGYYELIGGYKAPFIHPLTRRYLGGTTFEDVLALYVLDKRLRIFVYGYLCDFEQLMHQRISYGFCLYYGDRQSAYLDPNNYNLKSKNYEKAVERLTIALSNAVNSNSTHDYIVYQREKHGNVPLWVIMKTFSFGQLSTFYMVLSPSVQNEVAKSFPKVTRQDLEQYFKCLTIFRNICAHSERLFSFRLQADFPNTETHKNLGIRKDGRRYVLGKNDFFGLVIAFKYLFPEEKFRTFIEGLKTFIDEYFLTSQRLKGTLFDYLGFPSNWTDVAKVPK